MPHSANPKPSWYGELVGHYEGDTLVIDTIGQNDKSLVDVYRTPHTEKLHVVERWRIIDGGKMMEATFTVEDPDAFYQPWTGMRRYRRAQRDELPKTSAPRTTSICSTTISRRRTRRTSSERSRKVADLPYNTMRTIENDRAASGSG